mmetsp:Transcript_786/g.2012  ORF Transcript_786/g.2012 Transcript_786/m.2012 type:complete len:390 (-) Transcript_786:1576-2745(-)
MRATVEPSSACLNSNGSGHCKAAGARRRQSRQQQQQQRRAVAKSAFRVRSAAHSAPASRVEALSGGERRRGASKKVLVAMAAAAAASEGATGSGTGALIDGKAIAAQVRGEVKAAVETLKQEHGDEKGAPGLAVVLVGERKDSQTYVRNKKKACDEVGIVSYGTDLPETATEEEVLQVVEAYNADPKVHGILVQLPLPKHINEEKILTAISIEKDVDGFHPENIGKLAMRGRTPSFVCCTPKGCIELLERTGVAISGKRAVVVGRSNIVGTPAAMLLQERNATVTVVHSRTPDPEHFIREADIVVAACGLPKFVQGAWLKPGCAVIDVGINAVDDPSAKRGYRLVGDVDFAAAKEVAAHITPVPGGVGPMTIAMLLQNTLEGAQATLNK